MRINIKGNDVTPEKVAATLVICECDYNLKITGATIYVRFENEYGQAAEPLQNGKEFSRDFWFQKKTLPTLPRSEVVQTPTDPEPPADVIASGEMIRMCQDLTK